MDAARMDSIELRRRDAGPARVAEPSVGAALERVIELSHQVVVDRIELLQVESQARLFDLARRSVGFGIALFLWLLAWGLGASAAVVALAQHLPLEGALGVVAGTHAAAGAVALAWASRSPRRNR